MGAMDADSFKKIFLPLHPKLYRIALALVENKDDAEDILQEAYCKLWNKRVDLAGIRNPEAFSVTIIKNLCLDFLRLPRVGRNKDSLENVVIVAGLSPEQKLEEQDQIEQVKRLIDRLPENQRKVLKLKGINGCSLEEIEQITGLTAVNIRVLLSRARKTIRNGLEKITVYGR